MSVSKKINIPIVASLLAIPIPLFSYGDTGLPLSIIVSICGFLLVPFYGKDKVTVTYMLAILLATFGAVFNSIFILGDLKYNSIVSVLFFFLPAASFFLGFRIISTEEDFRVFIRSYVWVFLAWFFYYFLSIVFLHNGIVRDAGTMNGSILGIEVYGAYGVHSFIAFLIVSFFFIQQSYNEYKDINSVVYYSFILCWSFVIILSLSREAIVSLLFIASLYAKDQLTNVKNIPILNRYFISIVMLFIAFMSYDLVMQSWGTRLDQSSAAIDSADLNDLSSGRGTLVLLAIEQFFRNPFFGTGFAGYTLYGERIPGYEDLSGWSTHYYILTALWKMGSIPFVFYVNFWFQALSYRKNKYALTKRSVYFNRSLIITWLILNQFWDALMVPNVMGVIMFIAGGYYGISNSNKKQSSE